MKILTTDNLSYVSGGDDWSGGYGGAVPVDNPTYYGSTSSSQPYCSDYLTAQQYADLAAFAGMSADAVRNKRLETGLNLAQIYFTYCAGPQ